MPYCPNPDCSHLQRTQSPAEFRNGIERCSDCNTPLTPQPPQLRTEHSRQSSEALVSKRSVEWTLLTKVNNAHEANLIQSRLEAEDILVSIADEHMNHLVPAHSSILGWIKLRVPVEDLDRAQTILAQDLSADMEQISEEELTRAALAAAGPEEAPSSSPSHTGLQHQANPLKPQGPSWLLWVTLALGLLFVLWQSA